MNRRNLLMSLGAFPVLAAAQPLIPINDTKYTICYKFLTGNREYQCFYFYGSEKEIKNHIFQFEGEQIYFVIFKGREYLNFKPAINYLVKDGKIDKNFKEYVVSHGVIPINNMSHGKKMLFCSNRKYA